MLEEDKTKVYEVNIYVKLIITINNNEQKVNNRLENIRWLFLPTAM